ncbi:hypothetical protein MXB_5607, partial [Myxobolus squamalis]
SIDPNSALRKDIIQALKSNGLIWDQHQCSKISKHEEQISSSSLKYVKQENFESEELAEKIEALSNAYKIKQEQNAIDPALQKNLEEKDFFKSQGNSKLENFSKLTINKPDQRRKVFQFDSSTQSSEFLPLFETSTIKKHGDCAQSNEINSYSYLKDMPKSGISDLSDIKLPDIQPVDKLACLQCKAESLAPKHQKRISTFVNSTPNQSISKDIDENDDLLTLDSWKLSIKISAPDELNRGTDLDGIVEIENMPENMTKNIVLDVTHFSNDEESSRNLHHNQTLVEKKGINLV